MENKSLLGILLQNMTKSQRVTKMHDLFSYLVTQTNIGAKVKPEAAIAHLGVRGRVFDLTAAQPGAQFSDDTKSMAFVRDALKVALKCPICHGLLDPSKSVSYDHKTPIKAGGKGHVENAQLVHPYCNSIKD